MKHKFIIPNINDCYFYNKESKSDNDLVRPHNQLIKLDIGGGRKFEILVGKNFQHSDNELESRMQKRKDPTWNYIFLNPIIYQNSIVVDPRKRVQIMQHGCKYMDIIYWLMISHKTKINQLLKFHQAIYDLKQPMISNIMKRRHCRTAYKNTTSIKLGKVSR